MSVGTNPSPSMGDKKSVLGRDYKDEKEKAADIMKRQRGPQKNDFNTFNAKTATTGQKGNFGEYKADDNLVNNQSLKDAGYDLKPIGRPAPASLDDTIVKGIDGLYENQNEDSPIRYVIDEAKFGRSRLGKTEDGKQMSDEWLRGDITGNNRILDAVDGDEELAEKIIDALENGQVERVLTKIDAAGNVRTYRLDSTGKNIGTWP